VENFQIIHQTGVRNFKTVAGQAEVILGANKNKSRYQPMDFLNALELKMAAGAASVILSRAGSTIFEIASWGVPSILVPFANSNADHSKKNAFSYARAGACSVIEEANMTANILYSEIERLVNDKNAYEIMKQKAKAFGKSGASEKIAREIVNIALSHERSK
jgi:UDP-N-acetylglucosamine--N-acetylmuramyl-(pentapeptide) pyrophosphoryl-undecaprenol N-acetylglucosamine transferase